jgi:hypothetical protein
VKTLRRASLVGALCVAFAAAAEELPVALQAQLLSKMTTYVKALTPQGATAVNVWVVYPGPGEAPTRAAQALTSALTELGQMGTLKAQPKALAFADPKQFAAALAAEKPQVLFLTPEHNEKNVSALVEAAKAVPGVVTVTGQSDHVKLGVVLGFSAVEGRPRVLVNLKQAKAQGVEFHNGLLRYAVIVEQ